MTDIKVGQKYRVRMGGLHPFSDGKTLKVFKVDTQVHYAYEGNGGLSRHNRSLGEFEAFVREGVLTLVQEPMPELHGNPFEVPKALFDVDYSQLEQRAVASGELVMNAQGMAQHVHSPTGRVRSRQEMTDEYMQTLSGVLKRFIGQTATRTMHEEILQACRMNLPSRFKPSVQFDERGAFVGVKIRDRGTTDSYYVPPECRPRSPAQPAVPPMPMTATGGILDNLATYCGLHREPGESDESLRNRIAPSLGKGASAPKVNEESKPAQPINKVEKTMSRIVNVFLFDNTNGLKADQRLIGKIENIATDGSNQQVLMEVAVNHDIGTMLKEHNIKRKAIVNRDILDRVGKTVYMQPIELSEVTYQVVDVVHSR